MIICRRLQPPPCFRASTSTAGHKLECSTASYRWKPYLALESSGWPAFDSQISSPTPFFPAPTSLPEMKIYPPMCGSTAPPPLSYHPPPLKKKQPCLKRAASLLSNNEMLCGCFVLRASRHKHTDSFFIVSSSRGNK